MTCGLAYWAVPSSIPTRYSDLISGTALGFPLVASIFMAVHFWRIRKDGGISGPAPVVLESEMKAVVKKKT
jgi:hypothetical protein